MRHFFISILFFVVSNAFASPVTFVFSGHVTNIQLYDRQTGELIADDPDAEVMYQGIELINGDANVMGSYSFNSATAHLGGLEGPWYNPAGVGDDPLALYNGVTYQVSAEGFQAYKTPGVFSSVMSFDNSPDGVFSHFEVDVLNNTGGPRWTFSDFAFNFSNGQFQGGTFQFITDGVLSGALTGVIDRLTINEVPIPSALWLLGSGLLGLIGMKHKYKR
jgi:hypothetical protein